MADNFVNASVCALSDGTVERAFAVADMLRLQSAGAQEGTLAVKFRFRQLEQRVAIDGDLSGVVRLTCQRCMNPVDVPLQDGFNVVIVQDEAEQSEEIAGYEPVLADPVHFDLHALAEDQALLALPLVPRHESTDCNETSAVTTQTGSADAVAADEEKVRHRPFKNLRDMMRDR